MTALIITLVVVVSAAYLLWQFWTRDMDWQVKDDDRIETPLWTQRRDGR